MNYYDSDCFWTHEELGRKVIKQDSKAQSLLGWFKQLLVYVVDLEDHSFTEVSRPISNQASDRATTLNSEQNSYRAELSKQTFSK